MNFSAKTEYACLAMLALAEHHGEGEPVQIRRIATQLGIPQRFLVQILLQLKGVGLVASTRGAAGGYRLSRAPDTISLLDVVDVIEGDRPPTSSAAKRSSLQAALLSVCQELYETQREKLEAISLADLVHQAAPREPMWYI